MYQGKALYAIPYVTPSTQVMHNYRGIGVILKRGFWLFMLKGFGRVCWITDYVTAVAYHLSCGQSLLAEPCN